MKLHTRIIALFLSFWMLAVSTGFSMSLHYCEGELENWSVFNKAEACNHQHEEIEECCKKEVTTKSCCTDEKETKMEDSCCKSSEKTVLLDEDFNLNVFSFTLSDFVLINTLFIVTNTLQTNIISEEYFKTKLESPPIIIEDIPIFIQSFLI